MTAGALTAILAAWAAVVLAASAALLIEARRMGRRIEAFRRILGSLPAGPPSRRPALRVLRGGRGGGGGRGPHR